ncbi:toxin CfTX-B-like [Saccostrea cucullata]|uniref:toxin CfTX-B-like n=1 Tax=Saccostrea cuccullata TaxID=36930 RepID=UPI002ED16D82
MAMASKEDFRFEQKLTECFKKVGLDARAAENVFLELCTVFAGPKKSREVKQAINELKKCVNSDSGDVFNKLSFAINFVSKISAIHPIPATLATTFSVLSTLFVQVGNAMKTTVPSADTDSAYAAIERFQDSELKADAVGLEDLFYTVNAYLNSIAEDAPESIINHLENKFPTSDSVRLLGKLRAKTEELLYSDIKSAYRAAAYINLYSRLAILRSLVLWQLFAIKNRKGYDQSSAQGVQAMIYESEKIDLEVVKFVTESKFEKAVFLTVFNPTENEHFLHLLRIKQIWIPCIGQDKLFCAHTHLIRSAKWPDWKMEMSSAPGGSIRGSNNRSDACEFNLEVVENRNVDNIFYIRSKKWPSHYVYVDSKLGCCWSVSGHPGPEGQWKVIKLEGTSGTPQFLMSPLKWPCYFIYMTSLLNGTVRGTFNLKDIKEKGLWEILDI